MEQIFFFRKVFLCLLVIIGLASGNGCRKQDNGNNNNNTNGTTKPPPPDLSKPPVKQWDKGFGTSGDDIHYALALPTSDGGYLMGGYSNAGVNGDKSQDSRGDYDYWILKTDASGNKQWDNRFGGNGHDLMICSQQTNDGGYILGGWTNSPTGGDVSHDSRGEYDYWIVKTDANGTKEWDKRFGGSAIDHLMSIQQTTDGGYILGGYSYAGSANNGDRTQNSRGDIDYWIVKVDASGNKEWDKTFGGTDTDSFRSIRQTNDGGYIMGGFSRSGEGGDKTQPSRGKWDYWVVKVNNTGTKEWDSRFGGSGDDYLFELQQTRDGGYILGGYTGPSIDGDITPIGRGETDMWIVKIDSKGTKTWDALFGGSNHDWLYSIQQTADEGYVMGGHSVSGADGDKAQPSQGNSDYWIVKTDKSGKMQWNERFGGGGAENLSSVRVTNDYGYILGGYSRSNSGGDKTENTKGGYDYWIIKLGLK